MFNFALTVLAFVVAFAIVEGLKMAFGTQIALYNLGQGLKMMKTAKAQALQAEITETMMESMEKQAVLHDLRADSGNYNLKGL